MCHECEDIDTMIARYRRLRQQVNDHLMHEAADRLIAGLEADKPARHLKK
jgi:hypothetical protein